jgi:hypothetical protein
MAGRGPVSLFPSLRVICGGDAAPNGIGFSISKLAVAKSFEDVRTYSDGDAAYAVTVLVERV